MRKSINSYTAKRSFEWIFFIAVFLFFTFFFLLASDAPALDESFYQAQNQTTLILSLFFCVVSVVWYTHMKRRCTDNFIRILCTIIIATIFLWNVVAFISYLTPPGETYLLAFLCELRLVPLILIPSLLFFCALRIINFGNKSTYHTVLFFLALSSIALSCFALTNNFHMMVFQFDTSSAGLHITAYKAGFFLICGWIAAQLLSFFIAVFSSVQKGTYLVGLSFMFIALSLIALYAVTSLAKAYAINTIDSVFAYSGLFIIFLEGCMYFGILPSTKDYVKVLKKLPFQLFIYPHFPGKAFKTEKTSGLTSEEEHQLFQETVSNRANGKTSFHLTNHPNYLYHTYEVTGGSVILGENIDPVIGRRAELESQQKLLEAQVSALRNTLAIQKQLKKQETNRHLMAEIRKTIKTALSRIDKQFDYLIKNHSTLSKKEQELALFEVKMITSYAKRKCSLVITANSDEAFDSKRLDLVISEASIDMRTIGFTCGCSVNAPKGLSAAAVSSLYDYFFIVILGILYYEDVILMISINEVSNTEARLRIAIEYGEPATSDALSHLEAMKERLAEPLPPQIKDISLVIDEDTIDFGVTAFTEEEEK
ncbi:MAG: hypothetical protein ACI4BI_04435 [Anaerotardibacter sp.]